MLDCLNYLYIYSAARLYQVAKNTTSSRPPQTRESWVIAAFNALYREGIENVRVERIAIELGVTKGSFYWHFKNREDLLDALIDYWEKEMTQTVLDAAAVFHGSPEERLVNTFREIIGKERTKYDPAVRTWARTDTRIRKVVERVDQIRLTFLHGLFKDIGFSEQEAEVRARLMYYYVMGESMVTIQEPLDKRIRVLDAKIRIIMQPLSEQSQKGKTKAVSLAAD